MTVQRSATRTRYEGNGAATQFPTSFQLVSAGEIRVVLRRPIPGSGFVDEELIPGSDYSVTWDDQGNGAVTYPVSGAPMPEGHFLTIVSDVSISQEKSWGNLDAIDTKEIEKADDKLTRICQQLKDRLDRCVRLPVSAPDDPNALNPEKLLAATDSALTSEYNSTKAAAEAQASAQQAAQDALTTEQQRESVDKTTALCLQAAQDAAAGFASTAPAFDMEVTYEFPQVVAAPDGHSYRATTTVMGEQPGMSNKWVRLTASLDSLFTLDADGDLVPVTGGTQ